MSPLPFLLPFLLLSEKEKPEIHIGVIMYRVCCATALLN